MPNDSHCNNNYEMHKIWNAKNSSFWFRNTITRKTSTTLNITQQSGQLTLNRCHLAVATRYFSKLNEFGFRNFENKSNPTHGFYIGFGTFQLKFRNVMQSYKKRNTNPVQHWFRCFFYLFVKISSSNMKLNNEINNLHIWRPWNCR